MQEVLARGMNFIYTKEFILNKNGIEAWKLLVQSLSEDARKIWGGILLPVQEYPFTLYKEMISTMTLALNIKQDSELACIYEYVADQSLNKLYKVFFRFANPSFVIKNYPRLWSRFFNAGEVEVPVSENGHAILKFTLPEIFLDWLEPACFGYSKKAVEMAGGRNLTMGKKNTDKVSGDHWEIVYELNWTK
jgi:hypothetical protein